MSKTKEQCPECGGTEFEIFKYTYTCTSDNGCCDFSKEEAKRAAICDAFALGLKEVRRDKDASITYDGDPKSPRSMAYDAGRNVGEALLKEDE